MTRVFCSYSHADEALRKRLDVHLVPYKRQGVTVWNDREMLAGDQLDETIRQELAVADVILLLLSPDFIASPYCYDVEMQRAIERNQKGECRVIPVILRPCAWLSTPLKSLLAVPKDGKPVTQWPDEDLVLHDVATEIGKALAAPKRAPAVAQAWSAGATPFQAPSVMPPAPQKVTSSVLPKLNVRRSFTDADKDRFLDQAFEEIAQFFQAALAQAEQENQHVTTSFKRVDANTFHANIYVDGQAKARCKIWNGGQRGFAGGISYSQDQSPTTNSLNESLSVDMMETTLGLRPMGMTAMGNSNRQGVLDVQAGAEYLWEVFVRPLRR
ncbi:toll/interleukin-1 receptor domain-containing protein [Nitrospirillum viridazoti]|uniref:TIR domain-containing protein n=1 Tax=Nitrospirillum amazonense TaxID=28077 RepID=A0A560IAS6_9PROT|nr:toll/interleukin-1 receptor domain-containing protein [Nitrospirillum amazonense]TWB56132.1 TIR domain-containing protein [Nitrospirillum amazonense]